MFQDIEVYQAALRDKLADSPSRYEHCLRVADFAKTLAQTYHESQDKAYLAALLHDWDKNTPFEVLARRVSEASYTKDLGLAYGLSLGEDLTKVAPLLHGLGAALILKKRFPELDDEILQAIKVHTIAAPKMSALDMIVFVADALEPGRPNTQEISSLRAQVGVVSLEELFKNCFCSGICYVISTRRYLWPGSLVLYNLFTGKQRAARVN